MKLYLKFDPTTIFRSVLEEQLEKHELEYMITGIGEIVFKKDLPAQKIKELSSALEKYGIYILNDHKIELVQRIKDTITEIIQTDSPDKNCKFSIYLSEKLNYSYTYLSNLFSEVTYTSIENFLILKKIDYAKSLIIENKLTLSEIAYKLNYSSVGHLSNQFKKTTGLTPRVFQDIINRRKNKNIQTKTI